MVLNGTTSANNDDATGTGSTVPFDSGLEFCLRETKRIWPSATSAMWEEWQLNHRFTRSKPAQYLKMPKTQLHATSNPES